MIREVLKVYPNLCVYLLSLRIIKASRISINFQDVERLGDMDIDLLSGVALARLAKYQFNVSFLSGGLPSGGHLQLLVHLRL